MPTSIATLVTHHALLLGDHGLEEVARGDCNPTSKNKRKLTVISFEIQNDSFDNMFLILKCICDGTFATEFGKHPLTLMTGILCVYANTNQHPTGICN